MTTEIRVPTLGESISEATVGKWFKQRGDAVKADEPLVELETEKVTIEVNAPAAGVLDEIAAETGATVSIGALLGSLGLRRQSRTRRLSPRKRPTPRPRCRPRPPRPRSPPRTALTFPASRAGQARPGAQDRRARCDRQGGALGARVRAFAGASAGPPLRRLPFRRPPRSFPCRRRRPPRPTIRRAKSACA